MEKPTKFVFERKKIIFFVYRISMIMALCYEHCSKSSDIHGKLAFIIFQNYFCDSYVKASRNHFDLQLSNATTYIINISLIAKHETFPWTVSVYSSMKTSTFYLKMHLIYLEYITLCVNCQQYVECCLGIDSNSAKFKRKRLPNK